MGTTKAKGKRTAHKPLATVLSGDHFGEQSEFTRTQGHLQHFTPETLPHACVVAGGREIIKLMCVRNRLKPENLAFSCRDCTPPSVWNIGGGGKGNGKGHPDLDEDDVSIPHSELDIPDVPGDEEGCIDEKSKDAPSILLRNMTVRLLISEVHPDSEQPRKDFNEEDLDEFGDGLLEIGQLVPVVVSKMGEHSFRLIDGERRWRALKKKHMEYIDALFVGDLEKLGVDPFEISVIINFSRAGHTPMEIANAISKMIDIAGRRDSSKSHDEIMKSIAKKFCKSVPWLYQRLSLLRLTPAVQSLVSSRKDVESILPGVAIELAKVKDEELQIALAEEIVGSDLTANAARHLIRHRTEAAGVQFGDRKRRPSDDYQILKSFVYRTLDALNIIVALGPEKIIGLFFNREDKDRKRILEYLDKIIARLQKLRATVHNKGKINLDVEGEVKKLWEVDKPDGQGGEME